MTNKINLKQGIKKYYTLGFLFILIFGFVLIQEAKAKTISVGTASDNIGIGTDSPGTTYRLNVNGNSNITGTLNVTGGITGASLGATLLSASNVSAGSFGSNSGGGNYIFPGTLGVSGKLFLDAAEGLGVYGIRGRNTNEQVEMYNRVSIGSPNGWTSFPQAPVYGLSTYGGANFATNQGSVGIGTTGPGTKLDVIGSGTFGNNTGGRGSYSNGLSLQNNSGSATSLFLWENGVGSGHIGFRPNDANLYIVNSNSDGLITNPAAITLNASGNVGIGTTAPSAGLKLDVEGRVGATDYCDESGSFCIDPATNQKFYRHVIDVQGSCNNYYQVVVLGGDQTKTRKIKISRSYGTDPDAYQCYDNDSTPGSHVNALLFDVDVNQGGWGGQGYEWNIRRYQATYQNGLADAGITGNGNDFYVMLLGGYGATNPMRYYVDLYEYDSTVEVKYSSSETVSYGAAAQNPVTTVNWSNLYAHWDLTGRGIYSNGSSIGIGTTDPGAYRLNVNGNTNIIGTLTATSISGAMSGTLNAANLSAGTFGSNTGGGNYAFPSGGRIAFNGSSITSGNGFGVGNGAAYSNTNSIAVDTVETDGGVGGGGTLELNYYGGNYVDIGPSGTKPLRASILYDGNNTGYYVDPASTSNLNVLNANAYAGPITSTPGGGYITPSDGLNSSSAYDRMTYYDGYSGAVTNGPGQAWVGALTIGAANRGLQIAGGYIGDVYFRNGAGGWGGWNKFISSANIGSQSVNYASSAGSATNATNADTVDGWHRDDLRAWGNLTGKPTLPSSQEGARYTTNYNSVLSTGFFNGESTPANAPNAYGQLISARGIDTGLQIAGGYSSDNLYFRGWWSSGAGFSPWRTIIHSGNIGSQSVNYASSAGSASNTGYLRTVDIRSTDPTPNQIGQDNGVTSQFNNVWGGGWRSTLTVNGWGDSYAVWQLMGGSTTSTENNWYLRSGVNSSWNSWLKVITDDGSGNINIGSGTITSGGFIYNSDIKLKKNIATIESPLTKILQLRGVTFNWKKDNTPGVGLIAQEVEKVFPELVSEQNGIKSVQYGNLVAPLIEAVKEQQKEIQSLNERIKVLEAK